MGEGTLIAASGRVAQQQRRADRLLLYKIELSLIYHIVLVSDVQ